MKSEFELMLESIKKNLGAPFVFEGVSEEELSASIAEKNLSIGLPMFYHETEKSKVDIAKLQDGCRVLARFVRDTADGCSPDWGPPKEVTLKIERRDKDLRCGKTVYKAGEIFSLYVADFDWVEYHQYDYDPSFPNQLFKEEYGMQVLEVIS